jgi:hypothetical protein
LSWTKNLCASVVGACLISLGFALLADLISAAAAAQVKCPSGQLYDAATKKCSMAQATGKSPTKVIPTPKPGPPPPPPTISSISPIGGGAGTTVTLNGTGYAPGATVSVGDAQLGMAQASKITVVSPRQIMAIVPPGRSLSTNEATMVNVQVTVAGQTSKPILFSYCSTVTEYDPTRKECIPLPPTCGQNCPPGCPAPLVFSAAQNKCVPAPPVACGSGQIFSAQQNQCITDTELYKTLQFVIGTGGDDLRSDSTAVAFIGLPNGNFLTCVLKSSGQDSWGNNSSHTVPCDLSQNPMTLAQLQSNPIGIGYDGIPLNIGEGQDNWNLQSVTINAFNEGENPVCVFRASGNPLHRFQNAWQAVPSSFFGGVPQSQDPTTLQDGIIVGNYPGKCPP